MSIIAIIMDPRLSRAAKLGDVAALHALLEEDPLILEKIAPLSCIDTPLHIAAQANRTDFATHIISIEPSFARQPNKDGLTALHIASANGNVELVKELLKLGIDLCLLKDKDGQTPLHLAAARGNVDVIRAFVESFGKEAVIEFANIADKEGNTVLHLAVKAKPVEVLDFLLHELELKPEEAVNPDDKVWEEARGMILIVSSLILTVTYTAGMTPPQTIWKEGMKLEAKCIFHAHVNFYSSYSSCPALAYFIFATFNTTGFFASVLLIFFFRNMSYVQVLLQIALSSMIINFITLSVAMAPNVISIMFIYLITVGIFVYCIITFKVVRSFFLTLYVWTSKRCKWVAKWLASLFLNSTYCWAAPLAASSHGAITGTPTPERPFVKGRKDPEP